MKKRFETCTVTLTPLSPIHISGGNPDYGWGAVWLEKQKKIFILDSERFSQKLVEANLLDTYIEKVNKWLLDFKNLSERDKEEEDYYNPCYKFIKNNPALYSKSEIESFVEELSINEIAAEPSTRFVRNGKGETYIPGTSIKGAIRTAIIYAMLQKYKQDTGIDYLNDYLKEKLNSIPDYPKSEVQGQALRKNLNLDDDLLNNVLADFELTEKADIENTIDRPKPKTGSITNLMRAIIVSDSSPILMRGGAFKSEEIHVVMLENPTIQGKRTIKHNTIQVTKDKGDKKRKKQCLQADQNISITFKLTIDHEILRSFESNTHGFPIVFQGIEDLIIIIKNFYQKVWKKEQRYFLETMGFPKCPNSDEKKMIFNVREFYDTKSEIFPGLQPNINIGLGSGILCKTLFIAMAAEYQIKIRNLRMTKNQIANQNRGYDAQGNPVDWVKKLAPNSRHLVFRGKRNAYRPLGWANLQFGSATYEDNVL